MSRAVLISIRPEWVQKIITGEKTVEIRKARPNLETPFKCYIYETQGKSDTPWIDEDGHMIFRGRGKVVAEFTCDRINRITHVGYSGSSEKPMLRAYKADNPIELETNFDFSVACMSAEKIEQYLNGGDGYAWHITDARIFYPRPVELSEFTGVRAYGTWLERYKIQRAPQSWCYVEAMKNG